MAKEKNLVLMTKIQKILYLKLKSFLEEPDSILDDVLRGTQVYS